MSQQKTAILLHGIIRSRYDMIPLERRLLREGYDACINIQYPSTKHDLNDLCALIHTRLIEDPNYTSADRVDFITHSMGGLLARYLITHHRPKNLGSVVMLGTPNKGSEMADFLSGNKFFARPFRWLFGPASDQLRTNIEHFRDMEQVETIDYPLGIIASNISLNPLGKFIFGTTNDTLVTVDSTKIEGMTDHIVIPSTHAVMMFTPRIINQVAHFLKHEKFDHN